MSVRESKYLNASVRRRCRSSVFTGGKNATDPVRVTMNEAIQIGFFCFSSKNLGNSRIFYVVPVGLAVLCFLQQHYREEFR